MSNKSVLATVGGRLLVAGLTLALSLAEPAPGWAQQNGSARPGAAAPGRRRCPTCAPIPATSSPGAQRSARRGGDHTPSTDASISLGKLSYQGRVDADCELRDRAPVGGPRMYFLVMYPWFGRPLAPEEPKWQFDLEILRGPVPDVYQHFVFSFHDGATSGTIQVLPGAARYGSGTVRVTRRPPGARFEVQGVTDKGDRLTATIDCVRFVQSEAVGG